MKAISATLFFLLEAVLFGLGTILAANGKGFLLFFISLAGMAFLFVVKGCLGNAPEH